MTCEKTGDTAPAGTLHEKYGLSKTREAEDMCNYSEYLIEKGIEKGKLDILEQLEARHYSDSQIMELLGIDIEKLKSLREMLREKRVAVIDRKRPRLNSSHQI